MIEVVKRSGEREPFSESKVRRSLAKAGAKKATEEKIIRKLNKKIYSGITTKEIYRLVFAWLKQEKSLLASKYNLKQAIIDLGPTGYPFEAFLAKLLESFDYQVKVSQVLSGKCVDHEVDVIAKTNFSDYLAQSKEPACYLIECKFHGRAGIKVALKTALYIWARFYDLQETRLTVFGTPDRFTKGLLATNSRVTSEALKYCQCVGLAVLSWDYPKGRALPDLIDKSNKHPLTCLPSLSPEDKRILLKEGLIFCQDLVNNLAWQKLIGHKSKKIISQAKEMVDQE
ncbi:MAG: ATP cone domain-containing protein [Patescibacteria group bacterium]|jgi:hypothetical protein